MTQYRPIIGFTGSEIERAALVAGHFPVETALERAVKQKLASGLKKIADYLDPPARPVLALQNNEICC